MTAKAIGVFALVLAMASPALAGPENSVIGAGKLEEDMVHSGGTGYPSTFYEWWNKGKGTMDWGLSGELVYGGAWTTALAGGKTRVPGLGRIGGTGSLVRFGFGVNGLLRWQLAEKERKKVTNTVAILAKPGILIGGSTSSSFLFGIRAEVGAPVSIDVHERVSVVTGGYIPFVYLINKSPGVNRGVVPLLVRMGVEIKANETVAPWFYFDLGPGIGFGQGGGATRFAWRLGAGVAFWGVLGKNKDTSDSGAMAEPAEPVAE